MAKSHRAYDKNNNPLKFEKSFKERLKKFKNVDAWSKEGIAEEKLLQNSLEGHGIYTKKVKWDTIEKRLG